MPEELARLRTELARYAEKTDGAVEGIVRKYSGKTLRQWREYEIVFEQEGHLPYFHRAYSASIYNPRPGIITGEVGPDKNRPQGALGNLLEFGSVNNPPHKSGQLALERFDSRFANEIERLGRGLLSRASVSVAPFRASRRTDTRSTEPYAARLVE